ncbi:hypothetical protein FQV26_10455 [Planococcus sp. CPCC 101016]|uniref:Pycsar system effector family protein n=1 Tax=Planococcus sp. CPCC 101016 TaxID=2599617 RepID=UPI0011B5BC87|nr:Pycsar system effector family protein [Planococcus sp. CPCC 101016]TWT08205.1 hypothetical protein FQV26_10455 [Planococcus sp. CPCC 101016]
METEKLTSQLNKNDEWIQNADLKLSIILAFLGVLGGIILSQGKVFNLFKHGLTVIEGFAVFAFSLAFILLGIGITTAIKGLSATLYNPHRGNWFFGDVAKYENWHYFKRAKDSETPEDEVDDLLSQIHTTSKIAIRKFKWLNLSIKLSTWSLGSFAAYFVLINIIPFIGK